ncbi:hypothetical protein B296_00001743 [Ensete ventricosum]|uniref:Uncharacterized protein n=1 Tax=Ensete ventricosum TaxID=4639 RepID=A0A427A398_ENSVE|nr:hypothetical protein B296_00001743 [Ensete ventricosum]
MGHAPVGSIYLHRLLFPLLSIHAWKRKRLGPEDNHERCYDTIVIRFSDVPLLVVIRLCMSEHGNVVGAATSFAPSSELIPIPEQEVETSDPSETSSTRGNMEESKGGREKEMKMDGKKRQSKRC